MKIKLLSILLTSVLLLCACSNPNTSSYIGSRHQPILFDGTHIYGGMGTDLLSFVSTTTTTYSPLCMNPTCDHSRSNESCEARSTITINSFTLSSDGNVIVGGRDPADPFTYSAILLNTTTGKHQYIIKQIPNNINAMLVINDTLYFLSQIDDGDSNEGEHVVCYVPLSGGKVQIINLPEDDYYFAGADPQYLYLLSTYSRSILAVEYLNNFTYHTLYTFNESESTDCFIQNNAIYTYNNLTKKDVTATNNTDEYVDPQAITNNYTLYSLSKRDLSSLEISATSTATYQSTPWGTISGNYIYLPHFSPSLDTIRNDNNENKYPIHRNPGIDIIDINTMELKETIEIPNTNVIAVIHADDDIIVYYSYRFEENLMYYMGWYDRSNGNTHEYSVDWYDN